MKKQGQADRNVKEGAMHQPIPHAIDQGAVSRLGNVVGVGTPYRTMVSADGTLRAPMNSHKTSNSGSQGRH